MSLTLCVVVFLGRGIFFMVILEEFKITIIFMIHCAIWYYYWGIGTTKMLCIVQELEYYLHWILYSSNPVQTSSTDRSSRLFDFFLQLINVFEGHIAANMLSETHIIRHLNTHRGHIHVWVSVQQSALCSNIVVTLHNSTISSFFCRLMKQCFEQFNYIWSSYIRHIPVLWGWCLPPGEKVLPGQ